MLKLQQFFILKFSSERLKKAKYDISITLEDARINSEVISVNNSELVRTLFRLKERVFNQKTLDYLTKTRKKLKKLNNTEINRKKLEETNDNINKMLFIEDLVSIEFKNKAHYLEIVKRHGFYINGIRFVPFMASAGMIRKNTALFINSNIKHPLMDILENGRDETAPLVPAKFGAYFSLYSSSTLPVSFPTFAVIPDKEITIEKKVDFVTYQGIDEDDDVTTIDYPLALNAFDGQGLISPGLAKRWSDELELGYTFSCAIIRAPFMKGLVTVFDFHKFANEVAGAETFTDIYGNRRNIYDVEMIISESMFKLWKSYESTEQYISCCNKNKLGFAIAKVNHSKEKSYSRTSYQFLQILNLKDADIADLCEPTVDWFRNISGGSQEDMLLYATGERPFKPTDFRRMDVSVKAILIDPSLARDRYIQKRFMKSIEKKKKDAYMGSILINANYQFMVSDPYYQACHMFDLNEEPLLHEYEHYCEYWKKKGISTVSAIRSPIVHHSEFNILNLQDRQDVNDWYQHIHSGVIYPASGIGIDCVIHGGSDFDGDLICTVNNDTMAKGKIDGIPIMYESTKSEKVIVDSRNDKEQVDSQLNGHNSKVGFATNISSSLYSLLEEFPINSPERDTILKRLKIGRAIQGEIIDGVKGLKVPPFRNHWTRYKKITADMTPEETKKWKFNNRVLCQVRPAFFRFLYPHYMSRYNKELKKYNTYCILAFGIPFMEILKSTERTEEQEQVVSDYRKRTFFLDNNSVVNRISNYMRTNIGLVGKYSAKTSRDFDYSVLQSPDRELNVYKMGQMKAYLQEYKAFKKGLRHDLANSYDSMDSFVAYLRNECSTEISSNESELADYAIEITYGGEVSMVEFAWKMFPNGIIENIINRSDGVIQFPVLDEEGDIEYLWNKYSIKEFTIEELYES